MNTAVPASAETTLLPALPRRIGPRLALAGLALPELFDATIGAWLIGVMIYGF